MRRADRLFLIIHALQGRRTALPARRLADSLAVSLRTVYRDVADLQTSGVAIEGEAGVGYLLRKGSNIPPLMFTAKELESLVVGTRFVRAFGDAEDRRRAPGRVARSRRTLANIRAATLVRGQVRRDRCVARSHRSTPRVAHRVPRRGRQGKHARGRTAVPGLLGARVDAGRVVPCAPRLPQFPAGSNAIQRDRRNLR